MGTYCEKGYSVILNFLFYWPAEKNKLPVDHPGVRRMQMHLDERRGK